MYGKRCRRNRNGCKVCYDDGDDGEDIKRMVCYVAYNMQTHQLADLVSLARSAQSTSIQYRAMYTLRTQPDGNTALSQTGVNISLISCWMFALARPSQYSAIKTLNIECVRTMVRLWLSWLHLLVVQLCKVAVIESYTYRTCVHVYVQVIHLPLLSGPGAPAAVKILIRKWCLWLLPSLSFPITGRLLSFTSDADNLLVQHQQHNIKSA